MVIKIQKSHPKMSGTLRYNQNKAERGVADILAALNMDPGSGTFRDYERTFERYERMNIRTDDVSFQMSINPNPDIPGEALGDAEAVELAKRMMVGLGYGSQPILVYKHHDIERAHYHVVSIRTNDKGKKIKDSFERKTIQKLMKSLSQEFHFKIGNSKLTEGESATEKAERYVNDTPLFNPKGKNIVQQYIDLFDEALTYRFKTELQFKTIMRGMGVNVEVTEGNGLHLLFEGLNLRGEKTSPRVSEVDMGISLYSFYADRLQENNIRREASQEEKTEYTSARNRVDRTLAFCMERAKTFRHFELMLRKTGISLTLSRSEDGSVFGVTLADRRSRMAFKGSELKRFFDAGRLRTLAAPGGEWERAEAAAYLRWKQEQRTKWKKIPVWDATRVRSRTEAYQPMWNRTPSPEKQMLVQQRLDLLAHTAPEGKIKRFTKKQFLSQEDTSYIDKEIDNLYKIISMPEQKQRVKTIKPLLKQQNKKKINID